VRVTFQAPGYESDRLSASIARILTANALCSMATRTAGGTLHINTAFFCFGRDLAFYFLSRPDSLHCHNLTRVAQMAVAVFDSRQRWGDPHAGLQLIGTGGLASPDAAHEAHELYGARFPRYREVLPGVGAEQPQSFRLGRLRFYRFVPDRVQILDECEFGEEVFISARILR
jgi:uncharacterized protein YhbP (UPF0306 family)